MKKLAIFFTSLIALLAISFFLNNDFKRWTYEFLNIEASPQIVYRWTDNIGITHVSATKPKFGVSYVIQEVISIPDRQINK